jgi:hypothetical protein
VIKSGWVLSVFLLLPNVLWLLWPARESALQPALPRWVAALQPIEMAMRVVVFAMPFVLSIETAPSDSRFSWGLAGAGLTLYYAAWGRYFILGRHARLLFASWLGIPVPLAVAPTVYLLAVAMVTRSTVMGIAAIAFGAVHVTRSLALAHTLRPAE